MWIVCVLSSQVSVVFFYAFDEFALHTSVVASFLLIEFNEFWKTAFVLNELNVDVDSIECVFFNSVPLLPLNSTPRYCTFLYVCLLSCYALWIYSSIWDIGFRTSLDTFALHFMDNSCHLKNIFTIWWTNLLRRKSCMDWQYSYFVFVMSCFCLVFFPVGCVLSLPVP